MAVVSRISSRLVLPALRYVQSFKADPTALLERSGLTEAELRDPDARVDVEAYSAFIEGGADLIGDDDFGLNASQFLQPGDFGLLEYLVRTSANGHEAIEKAGEFAKLLGDIDGPPIEFEDDLVMCCAAGTPDPFPRQHAEYLVGTWTCLARLLRGPGVEISEVRFTHAEPATIENHRRIFGCAVRFDQRVNALVFPASHLDAAFSPTDPELVAAVERRARAAMEIVAADPPIASRARVAVERALDDGKLFEEHVASKIGVSARTLRRKLKECGESFQSLCDSVRHERALRLVADGRMAIGEISFVLGFSETSSFHRAFRRWTGTTPAKYRAGSRGG